MFQVYFWKAKYKVGEDTLIIGADSKEDAEEIARKEIREADPQNEIIEIKVLELIPFVIAEKKGVLEVF